MADDGRNGPGVAAAPPQMGEAPHLYGVAPGAVTPFAVTPAEIPPYTPPPDAPISGTPAFASAPSAAAASPTGYGVAPPLYVAPCRVCGLALAPNMPQCPRCGTPAGMIVNANDPTANSYLPVGPPGPSHGQAALGSRLNIAPDAGVPQSVPNTSGQRGGAAPADLPVAWNWGAAFATYFWAFPHRAWWYVALQTVLIVAFFTLGLAGAATNNDNLNMALGLVFILYWAIWIICRIVFGIYGNRMAWRKRRFDHMQQFVAIQEAWKPAGVALGIIGIFCLLVAAVIIVAAMVGALPAK